jgi:hypothetical protein
MLTIQSQRKQDNMNGTLPAPYLEVMFFFPLQTVHNIKNNLLLKTQRQTIHSHKHNERNGSHLHITVHSYKNLPTYTKAPHET